MKKEERNNILLREDIEKLKRRIGEIQIYILELDSNLNLNYPGIEDKDMENIIYILLKNIWKKEK